VLSALDNASQHIAERVERQLARESRRPRRRLLELRLRELLECLEIDRHRAAVIARDIGLLELIEAARDAYLETLDATDALLALNVQWGDVALALRRRLAETEVARDRRTCPRCFDLLVERTDPRARSGKPRGRRAGAVDDGEVFVTRRCPRCGYTLSLMKH
jgi:ribosomal protein S27AE